MTDREPYSDRQPAASVVVPVYNKAPHLKACFDCLECQTISKSDLEVLLIDDGSTDESLALCEAFAAERPWVRVIAQPNAGVSEARNAGIRAARGRYLFFLDPDETAAGKQKSCYYSNQQKN